MIVAIVVNHIIQDWISTENAMIIAWVNDELIQQDALDMGQELATTEKERWQARLTEAQRAGDIEAAKYALMQWRNWR